MNIIIDVLTCFPDGTQTIEQQAVPDDYFPSTPEPIEPEPEKLSYDDLVALVGELKAQVDNLTEEQARAWEAVAEGAPLAEVAAEITAKTKIGEVK